MKIHLPHIALQLELWKLVLTLGIIDDGIESDEDGFYGAGSVASVDGDPEAYEEVPEEHILPLGFHVRGSGYDEEDA